MLVTLRGQKVNHFTLKIALVSPYCLPYNSFDISVENLVLDQLVIPLLKHYSHHLSA